MAGLLTIFVLIINGDFEIFEILQIFQLTFVTAAAADQLSRLV